VSERPEQREPEQADDLPTLDEGPPPDEGSVDEPTELMTPDPEDTVAEDTVVDDDGESVAAVEATEPVLPDTELWTSSIVREPGEPPPRVRAAFPIVFRGYDREVVDNHLAELEEEVLELHATRSPQAAVKRELDRVGQETAAILQRAHEAADEVARRSRSKADARVEEAERESARLVKEAEAKARRLDKDADDIWAERRKLLEDARRMGERLIEIADEALERFPPAEDGGPPAEPPAPEPPAAPTAPGPPRLEEVPPHGVEPDPGVESVRRIPRPGAPRHPRRPRR
jgi:DivIVA protein